MSWVDASASAAATQNPIGTLNAESNIVFGNGTISTPNDNEISPDTSTSAVAALGSAGDAAGTGGGGTEVSDPGTSSTPIWLYIGLGLGTSLLAIIIVRYRKKIFSL